jgi:hypothetical protein
MFHSITLHGAAASIVWGYQTAVDLRAWRIVRTKQGWELTATTALVNPRCARKSPLYFTAPRKPGPLWCFPVIGELVITGTSLTAPLGPPEQ